MAIDSQNMIWLDLEMTGLDPQNDTVIEIATVVTDKNLNVLAEGPILAIHQSEAILSRMDDWNQKQHGGSGLIQRVRDSAVDEAAAEQITLEFLRAWVPSKTSPMCGNSICQDRRFLYRCMPKLEAFFHYRNLDVSTIKELAARWAPELKDSFKKSNNYIDKCRHNIIQYSKTFNLGQPNGKTF